MVKIISDSTCDLSQEVLERYDIDIIPLHIVKGDEELEDGPQIDIHAFSSKERRSTGSLEEASFLGLSSSLAENRESERARSFCESQAISAKAEVLFSTFRGRRVRIR